MQGLIQRSLIRKRGRTVGRRHRLGIVDFLFLEWLGREDWRLRERHGRDGIDANREHHPEQCDQRPRDAEIFDDAYHDETSQYAG